MSKNGYQRKKVRQSLMRKKRNRQCCFCGTTITFHTATIEHVIPLAHGGGWENKNLKTSCKSCNLERGTEDFEVFKAKKKMKPTTPVLS
jgi:CRISPR-associated endonuclease Csn1